MLDGMHPDRTGGKGGSSLNFFHLVDVGVDDRRIREVDTSELEAMPFRSGLDGQGYLLACVEGGALEGGGSCKSAFSFRMGGGSGHVRRVGGAWPLARRYWVLGSLPIKVRGKSVWRRDECEKGAYRSVDRYLHGGGGEGLVGG